MRHGANLCGGKLAMLRQHSLMRFMGGIAIFVIPLAVMAGLLAPRPLRAQVGTSDVLGTVTDSTGAVVVGANVAIKNLGTAEKRTATTSDKGEYLFSTLPNGSYSLTVEAKGFETFAIKRLSALRRGSRPLRRGAEAWRGHRDGGGERGEHPADRQPGGRQHGSRNVSSGDAAEQP